MSIKQILLTSLLSIILFIILEIIILLWLYSIGVLHIICYIILGSSLSGGMGFLVC